MTQEVILTGFVVEQPLQSGIFLDIKDRNFDQQIALISDCMSASLSHGALHTHSRLHFEPYLGKRITVQGHLNSNTLWNARIITVFYHSAEIRWFLSDNSSRDALISWFTRYEQIDPILETENYIPQPNGAPFIKQERLRTDEYLLLPNCETVGVKQRQGRLEVKALVVGPRPFTQDGVAGRVDEWVKWSLKPYSSTTSSLETELHQSGVWCMVEKRRYTQKYAASAGKLVAVSPDAWPDAGCNIELTLLGVGQKKESWMTFGFEAFGTPNQVAGLLAEAVAHFFTIYDLPSVELTERNSLSYPAWLAVLP
jgi:hypothetical protein